jgi:hypothetical protein
VVVADVERLYSCWVLEDVLILMHVRDGVLAMEHMLHEGTTGVSSSDPCDVNLVLGVI